MVWLVSTRYGSSLWMTSSYVGHDSITSIVVITSSDMEQTVHGGCSQHVGVATGQHEIAGGLHFLHGFSTTISQLQDEQSEHSVSVNQQKYRKKSSFWAKIFWFGFIFYVFIEPGTDAVIGWVTTTCGISTWILLTGFVSTITVFSLLFNGFLCGKSTQLED